MDFIDNNEFWKRVSKVGSLRKSPKPSISPSSSIIPTATPSGVMSNAPFLL